MSPPTLFELDSYKGRIDFMIYSDLYGLALETPHRSIFGIFNGVGGTRVEIIPIVRFLQCQLATSQYWMG